MTPKREKKRANLRDVAHAAGVSVATVSRVLNSPEVVNKDTREKVEAAIDQLSFHPSAAARAINSGRTKIIGALIPTLDNDIFALTIDAIENRLGDFGFSLVVATTGEDPDTEVRRAKELLDIGAEGLFLPGVTHGEELYALLDRTRVPAVVISYYDPDFRYPTIGYDNREAARLALGHLLDLGHRKIAVVHGPTEHNDRTRARLEGAATELEDVSVTCFETELSAAGGCSVIGEVLGEGSTFDAFLCVSDVLSFGVISELQRNGFAVPQDFSVMGIHDLPNAEVFHPRLSTVRLPAREMGRSAAEALAHWVEKGEEPLPVCFPSSLARRESTSSK
jgi:LacI family transcriptional regulator